MSGPRVLLVCSAGGHLLQLHALLGPVWSGYERHWVCLQKPDAVSLLKDEPVTWAYGPTNRSVLNLLRNLALAWTVLRREKPTLIASTGAGVAVPFIWLGRLLGIRTLYIESFARQDSLSLSGRLVQPVVHDFIVQHPGLVRKVGSAGFYGSIY